MYAMRSPIRCALAAALSVCLTAGCLTVLNQKPVIPVATAPDAAVRSVPPVRSTLMEPIRSSLSEESWRPNHGWSAEGEYAHRNHGFPVPESLHWKFGKDRDATNRQEEVVDEKAKDPSRSESPALALSASQSKSTVAAARKSESAVGPSSHSTPQNSSVPQQEETEQWNGFWPLTVSDLVQHGTAPGHIQSKHSKTADEGLRCLKSLAQTNDLVGWNAAILCAQQDPRSAGGVADVLESLILNPRRIVVEKDERVSGKQKSDSTTGAETSGSSKTQTSKITTAADGKAKKVEVVDDPKSPSPKKTASMAMQCAAAEALCLVLAARTPDPIDGLASAGRLLERVDLPIPVRAELFRGAARWVRPANIPRLENAFREGDAKERAPVEIRRAAIEACLVHAIWNGADAHRDEVCAREPSPTRSRRLETAWPTNWQNCRIDPDVQVRQTFVHWLGVAQPPQAFSLLQSQFQSTHLRVHQAALESLAKLHTDAAHVELRKQVAKTKETLKAAAVHALAAWGMEEIAPFARDPSRAVRLIVAQDIARWATVDAAVVLLSLALDRDVEVQLAVVGAVKEWPDGLAFPLLLQAMSDSSAKTRLQASLQLASRKKDAIAAYRFDGPPEERALAVREIATQIGASLNYLDQVLMRAPQAVSQVKARRAAEVRAQLTALIENPDDSPAATAAREWLAGIGARDIPIVESFLDGPTPAKTDAIFRDVLPKLSPGYAALIDLADEDVNVRRRGAAKLAELGQKATLSRPIVGRLRELLAQESDELVWRSAMTAVASDSTDECASVANLALHHRSAEVRQLGCGYVFRHGRPIFAPWLLDLLSDPNRSVQLAAIEALGNCGNLIAVRREAATDGRVALPNLRDFLSSPDQAVHLAAAISLCRIGAPEGIQELVRLSYHTNSKIRERVVAEMGRSGQTRFIGHLIELGWTEHNDQVQRIVLTSLDQLVPAEDRPTQLGEIPAVDAKIKCWAEWWERRHGVSPQNVPAGAPLTSRPQPRT